MKAFAKPFVFATALLLGIVSAPVLAVSSGDPVAAIIPAALSTAIKAEIVLAIHPTVGTVNQPRKLFLQQFLTCPYLDFSIDLSLMETQSLVVVRGKATQGLLCFPAPSTGLPRRGDFEFTPTKAGALTIRWVTPGRADLSTSVTIHTLPDVVASKFDINGMWFDAATNGSGIALHHRRTTTDVAFGTWFLFDNFGLGRWYTLQAASWQQDGSVLEGLLYTVAGTCTTANLIACPAAGGLRTGQSDAGLWETPSRVRITFQSSVRARAEALTLNGDLLFTSELTKLSF